MPDGPNNPVGNLSFSQRQGLVPLPEPMRMGQLSDRLRCEIWNILRQKLLQYKMPLYNEFSQIGIGFVERVLGKFFKKPEDGISIHINCEDILAKFKRIAIEFEYNNLIDFLEIVVNDQVGADLAVQFQKLFDVHAAPYQVDTTQQPFCFFPRSSAEQGKAIQDALHIIEDGVMLEENENAMGEMQSWVKDFRKYKSTISNMQLRTPLFLSPLFSLIYVIGGLYITKDEWTIWGISIGGFGEGTLIFFLVAFTLYLAGRYFYNPVLQCQVLWANGFIKELWKLLCFRKEFAKLEQEMGNVLCTDGPTEIESNMQTKLGQKMVALLGDYYLQKGALSAEMPDKQLAEDIEEFERILKCKFARLEFFVVPWIGPAVLSLGAIIALLCKLAVSFLL